VLDGGPGASSCAFVRLVISPCGDLTVDAIGQLLVRELLDAPLPATVATDK
jgi:hypothetical protein